MGVELGSAFQPVKIEVGGEDFAASRKNFCRPARDAWSDHADFWPRPAIWRLFCGPGHFARSARVALSSVRYKQKTEPKKSVN